MIAIEETILPNGLVNYSLSKPYDTYISFHSKSKHHATLNLESLVESYDFKQCLINYNNDDERDSNGNYLHDFDYFIKQAPRKIEGGIFLHFSDDGDCFLIRYSSIRLTIDKKIYKLPCFFAPRGIRASDFASDLYFRITPNILKELAAATSISLSYITNDEKSGFEDKDMNGFKKYAIAYYEGYYIEHKGTQEEKEKLRQELQPWKDAIKKLEEEERARIQAQKDAIKKLEEERIARIRARKEAIRKSEEEAMTERKAEWDSADPMTKVIIMLKRKWKLVLLILLILLFFFC